MVQARERIKIHNFWIIIMLMKKQIVHTDVF
jgi:hypothetical protein